MKIDIDKVYKDRVEQIELDLKKEYYKGARRNKGRIAQLLQEKKRLQGYLKGDDENK